MTSERIKEIQEKTAYPNSVSVQQALLQVWKECEQERNNQDANKWISVSEKMPSESIQVICTDGKEILIGYIDFSVEFNMHCVGDYEILNDITHWQNLPSTDSINLK